METRLIVIPWGRRRGVAAPVGSCLRQRLGRGRVAPFEFPRQIEYDLPRRSAPFGVGSGAGDRLMRPLKLFE